MKFCRNNKLSSGRLQGLIKLRNALHHLISNIWIYFQSDVVLLNWTGLRRRIEGAQDFEQLRGILEDYVRTIGKSCFLSVDLIMRSINHVVDITREFVKRMARWFSEPDNRTPLAGITNIHDDFVKVFSILFNEIGKCSKDL
jgi:hypothetical protein